MFTGIVEEIGEVKSIFKRGSLTLLKIAAPKILDDTKIGDSIAVNGACLTVIKKEQGFLSFEVMPETLNSANLGLLRVSNKVNIERALKLGDRLSGHFVTGHIDDLGIIQKKIYIGDTQNLVIRFPVKLNRFIVPKGSICVEGASLTVQELKRDNFSVALIPHTLKTTNLGLKNVGDRLNLEVDLLGKYVLKDK